MNIGGMHKVAREHEAAAKTQTFNRVREIIKIMYKYKIWRLFKQIFVHASKSRKAGHVNRGEAEQIKFMFEELGPTFMKLGQVLTMRPDLLPREYIRELEKLYDAAKPFPYQVAKAVIEKELEAPLNSIFQSFEEVPIAAASIGQVHRATLRNGEKVIVKVQRPGIETLIRTDLNIIYKFAGMAEALVPTAKTLQLQDIVDEIDKMLYEEMNYLHEAHNVDRFYQNFRSSPNVIIPRVYHEFTTAKVLTLEYIEGLPVSPRILRDNGYSPEKIANIIACAVFKQIFKDGFFHADPSPGNIFVVDHDKIAFVDFGAVGEISEERRRLFVQFPLAILAEDTYELVDILLKLGEAKQRIDKEELARDLEGIINYYHRVKPTIYDIEMANAMIEISEKHKFRLPADFMLIERALFETGSVCNSLDPNFDMLKATKPVLNEVAMEQYQPRRQLEEWGNILLKYYKLFKNFPARMDKILRKAEEGSIRFKMSMTEPLLGSTGMLPFAILIAALTVASALIILSNKYTEIGIAGFVITMILSIIFAFYALLKPRTTT
jgi:ubiquinone biosynthesis protein